MSDLTKVEILVGTGGIGSGIFFELQGDHTLGRNESRAGKLRDWRDYCKLHIIAQTFAMLANGRPGPPIRVLPVGKVGDDDVGRRLIAEMNRAGIDTSYVDVVQGVPTLLSVSFIYPDSTGGNITADNSASGLVDAGAVDRVEPEMAAHPGKGIAVVVPEVPLTARERLLELATKYSFFRVASFTTGEIARADLSEKLHQIDLLALNIDEAAALAKVEAESDPTLIRKGCAALANEVNPDLMFYITAGPEGSWAHSRGEWEYIPPLRVQAINTAGAGDAYLAGVLAALVAGMPFRSDPPRDRQNLTGSMLSTACDYGTVTAAFSVTSPHAIHPDLNATNVDAFAAKYGLHRVFPCEEVSP